MGTLDFFRVFKHPQVAKIATIATVAIIAYTIMVMAFDAVGTEAAAPGAQFVFALTTGLGMTFFTAASTAMAKGGSNTAVYIVALSFVLFFFALILVILEFHALAANPLEDFGPAIIASVSTLFTMAFRGEMSQNGD